MSYIRTFTGLMFDPSVPRAEDVCIEDIAHSLSQHCRWGGHCPTHYSVAAHCAHVVSMMPKEYRESSAPAAKAVMRAALLHDASEAYLCDVPKPIKALLPQYQTLEAGVMRCVADKYGFSFPVPGVVHQADMAALFRERRDLFDFPVAGDIPPAQSPGGYTPHRCRVVASWGPQAAEREFLRLFCLYA